MAYNECQEKLNIFQKNVFKHYLENCNKEKEADFKSIVYLIGNQWSVLRTVKNKKKTEEDVFNDAENTITDTNNTFQRIAENLFQNRKKILRAATKDWLTADKDNHYLWWESDTKTYSYESKICFLLNPKKYKIIYDNNNTAALESILKKIGVTDSLKPKNWQHIVDEYWWEIIDDLKSKDSALQEINFEECTVDDIFRIDCKLWIHGAKLLEEKK